MANSPSAALLRLRAFIAERRRMSPIDQPLMLMELLGRRSQAPAQGVARRILGSAWWAGFTFNGITAYGDGHDSLIGGDELSDGGTWPKASVAEPRRDELLELCWERLDAFRGHRHAAGPVLRPHGEGRVAPRRARIQIGSRRQSRMA
ncbi:hypothetical protein IQ216_12205 [Cyanobium sp. LEGE 06143]|uniref:hypothetical protein n=1 Tax=Cyanobium sp. LEGE 06143 TaxID=945727 RepID=UPI00187F0156|nr:hypothetical protein [Cyanobium sp. LEGE 06143]MBE9173803.1 hypothetical protein [Cyanobium sp. LEGE 06143]